MFAPKVAGPATTTAENYRRERMSGGSTPVGQVHSVNRTMPLSRAVGNQATLRLLRQHGRQIQPKLAVGPVDDPLEREADRVAEQLSGTPDNPWATTHAPPQISRKCAACETDDEPKLRTKTAAAATRPAEAPPIVQEVLGSPGQPLDAGIRALMEPRLRHDLSGVRVHVGDKAAEAARAVDARAFTFGHDTVFGTGEYAPQTAEGRKLIAHELVHVVQQTGAGDRGGLTQVKAEAEAWSAAGGGPASAIGSRPYELARAPSEPLADETPMTDTELLDFLVNQRGFDFSKPGAPSEDPAGVGRGIGPQAGGRAAGDAVFAAVQITDKSGNLVDRSVAAYFGGGDAHAEAQALASLEHSLAGREFEGGELLVVVDQFPCSPTNRDCTGKILAFARRFRLRPRIRVPTRPAARGGSSRVKPRTAARGAQRTDFPKTELEDFNPAEHAEAPATGDPAPGTQVSEANGPAQAAAGPPGARRTTGAPEVERGASEPAGTDRASGEAPVEFPVGSRFRMLNTEGIPGGRVVSEVEVVLGDGLKMINARIVASGGKPLPASFTLRVTSDAHGALVAVEASASEAAGMAETLARQALALAPRAGVSGAGGAAGAAGVVSPWVRGASWAGLVIFAAVTIYRYETAEPEDRPRVLARAGGGFAAGMAGGYALCNLVLGIETLGWSLLICGALTGVPAGMAGEAIADVAYDEATIHDDEIRGWVDSHGLDSIGRLPAREKLRLIFSLMRGWISDEDVQAIERILSSVKSPTEMAALRQTIKPHLIEMSSIGQRTQVDVALARQP